MSVEDLATSGYSALSLLCMKHTLRSCPKDRLAGGSLCSCPTAHRRRGRPICIRSTKVLIPLLFLEFQRHHCFFLFSSVLLSNLSPCSPPPVPLQRPLQVPCQRSAAAGNGCQSWAYTRRRCPEHRRRFCWQGCSGSTVLEFRQHRLWQHRCRRRRGHCDCRGRTWPEQQTRCVFQRQAAALPRDHQAPTRKRACQTAGSVCKPEEGDWHTTRLRICVSACSAAVRLCGCAVNLCG